jgi:rRNA-processing protein FCF1
LLNEEDINHLLAVNIAKNLKGSKILIPAMVIAELMSNTRNKRARECTIKATLKTADEIPTLDDSNLIRYIDFAGNLPNTFTAIDSIILFLAKENNARLITFDKKLQKLYKGA